MAIVENLTPFAVGELVSTGRQGQDVYTVVVKASFDLKAGTVVASDVHEPVHTQPIRTEGNPEAGLLSETDLVPIKPRVDVLLTGAIVAPRPVTEVDVALAVGGEIRKVVRVIGDRRWIPGVMRTLSLTSPVPWSRMPVEWEKAFGGKDAVDATRVDRRNPVGRGASARAESLEGSLAPNFEDPARLIGAWNDRPEPVGFGPVASHWLPRANRAGTYDKRWRETIAPRLPEDFDPGFFNAAPPDQQIARYVPGTEVVLVSMTDRGRDTFRLPAFSVPLTFVDRTRRITEVSASPDTIVIDPERRKVFLVARGSFTPAPDATGLVAAIVGTPSAGRVRALRTGKCFLPRQPANR